MKTDRQAMILTLISEYQIETQEELQARLQEAGFRVTQATISRDMRELRVNKVTAENGKQCYAILSPKDPDYVERFTRVFLNGYSSCELAGNILVLKTVTGMAMAVATALDNLDYPEVVGCVAGDDTIFAACRSNAEAAVLMKRVREMTGSMN